MIELKAPNTKQVTDDEVTLFLAGSIENGAAVDWQSEVKAALADMKNLVIFNPRRDDWNASWTNRKAFPPFAEQVRWEHRHLLTADVVCFNFCGGTVSPITLMELGMVAGTGIGKAFPQRVIIRCPDDYFRKGNVEMIAEVLGVQVLNTYDEFITAIRNEVEDEFSVVRNWIEP